MKKTRNTRGIIETLLVIGLILLILLFFSMRTAAEQNIPAPQPTTVNMPTLPTAVENTPEESEAQKPKQPPACTFPLAEIKTPESTPESYTFSEPQVVLTASEGNLYGIVAWTPDNQHVLITEDLNSSYVESNSNTPQQSISLYNPETSELNIYAIRQRTEEPPSWNPALNAVVYPVMNYFNIDRRSHSYKLTRQIWVSYGDPNTAQLLDDNLSQIPLAIKPDGSELLYLLDKKISKLDKSLKKLSTLSFDSAQLDYGKGWRNQNPVSYKMAWQPGTSLIFLYSDGGVMGGGGYTFILNADTGNVCDLDFGGWVAGAHWSSDGRYLAIGRATNSHPADLTLLDIQTGNLTTLRGAPQGIDGQLYLNDFIWAPDNRHLLALGSIRLSQNNQDGNNVTGLYLVDIVSGQSTHVVPGHKSLIFLQGNNFAWSPDGLAVAIHCPLQTKDQICLISVQKVGQ
jgi:hypothetical protein